MHFKEIATRLNGFSTPIFGVSWTPPTSDRQVARKVVVFLEDRRVLYEPSQAEIPQWCVESVLEIRVFLTDVLAAGGIADELDSALRAIRSACRAFLDNVPTNPDGTAALTPQDISSGGWDSWTFNQALGQLRGTVGGPLATIVVGYGIDVEPPLLNVLPLAADGD